MANEIATGVKIKKGKGNKREKLGERGIGEKSEADSLNESKREAEGGARRSKAERERESKEALKKRREQNRDITDSRWGQIKHDACMQHFGRFFTRASH